jgi:hypothetical protein
MVNMRDERVTNIHVECYAGYRGEEAPRRFYLGDQAVDVLEVLDRWLSPEHRYFKCRGADDATYILRQDVSADRWELTFYKRSHMATNQDRLRE